MQRIQERPGRVRWLVSAYTFATLTSVLGAWVWPPALVAALPLLLLAGPSVLLYGVYYVSPDSEPTREELVLRLVGVFATGVLLAGNRMFQAGYTLLNPAKVAANPSNVPTMSLVDRIVAAVVSGLVMWGVLAGLAAVADAVFNARRGFIQSWHCSQCGYDLRGSTGDHCPECAAPIFCRRCGRSLVGVRSDICIQCGTPRVADPYEDFDD